MKKLQPAPDLHPTVEELFRAWLDRSVTAQVQSDGALSAATGISTQPTRRSLNHLNQAMAELEQMALSPANPSRQAPPPPHPPPQLSSAKSSPAIYVTKPSDESDDSLSTQASSMDLPSSIYEPLEAGRAATLPRNNRLAERPAVPRKRGKSVSFASDVKPEECPYATVRRSPTPYSAANRLLSEL